MSHSHLSQRQQLLFYESSKKQSMITDHTQQQLYTLHAPEYVTTPSLMTSPHGARKDKCLTLWAPASESLKVPM